MRLLIYFILLFVFSAANAQTPKSQKKDEGSDITQIMIKDLHAKNPETKDEKVLWNLTEYGYRASYTLSNLEYMTWYSREGIYLETLVKTSWDDRVPAILKMELDNSDYNTCKVITFWESINSNHENYCLELMDREGKALVVWADENGKFSKIPVFAR